MSPQEENAYRQGWLLGRFDGTPATALKIPKEVDGLLRLAFWQGHKDGRKWAEILKAEGTEVP